MNSTVPSKTERVLLIGDSLACARPHRGQKFDITWPVLLKNKYPNLDVWQRCRAGSMTNEVIKEYNLFSDSIDAFSMLVIQVGIGDCCPRPYPHFFHKLILTYELNKLHKKINSYYPFLLKFFSKPWISKEYFLEKMRFMIETTKKRNPSSTIVVVKIGTPCNDFVKKVHNVPKYAELYNKYLEELCASFGPDTNVHFVDPYVGYKPEELFIEDGHHLTVLGHEVVAKALDPYFARLAK